MLEKLKKEPRIAMAIATIIFLFLPFLNVGSEASVMGYSSEGNQAISGLQLLDISFLCLFFYVVILGLVAVPLLKDGELNKKLYLILSIGAIFLLIVTFVLAVFTVGKSFGNSYFDMEIKVTPAIGFWLILLCNGAILVWTCMHDFGIKNKEDIKKSISQIDIEKISNQANETMKGLGNAVQSMGSTECLKCGKKIKLGKKFCPYCGEPVPEKEKTQSTKMEMQKCESCGNLVAVGTKFCPECGTPVPKKEEIKKDICLQCGAKIPENAKFCLECGTPVKKEENKCPQCGTEFVPGTKFCLECGKKLGGEE